MLTFWVSSNLQNLRLTCLRNYETSLMLRPRLGKSSQRCVDPFQIINFRICSVFLRCMILEDFWIRGRFNTVHDFKTDYILQVSAFREVLEIMHDASIKSDDQVISGQLQVDFKKFIRKAGPVMHELHQSLIPYSSKSRVHKLMMNMKDIRQEMVQSLTPPSR